jgi:hypothetical protein
VSGRRRCPRRSVRGARSLGACQPGRRVRRVRQSKPVDSWVFLALGRLESLSLSRSNCTHEVVPAGLFAGGHHHGRSGDWLDSSDYHWRTRWVACRAVHEEPDGTPHEYCAGHCRGRCCQLVVQPFGYLVWPGLAWLSHRGFHRCRHPDLHCAGNQRPDVRRQLRLHQTRFWRWSAGDGGSGDLRVSSPRQRSCRGDKMLLICFPRPTSGKRCRAVPQFNVWKNKHFFGHPVPWSFNFCN